MDGVQLFHVLTPKLDAGLHPMLVATTASPQGTSGLTQWQEPSLSAVLMQLTVILSFCPYDTLGS